MTPAYMAEAFGLRWRSDIALPGFDPAPGDGGDAAIDIRRIGRLPERTGGRPVNRGYVYPDGIRFAWRHEVVFDMTDGVHIAYCPGDAWTGALPTSFYSTVAALTLAWRGLVPLHACAVELDGRAVLIAGPAGAGKSTLTAGLLAQGGRFVADDLVAAAIGTDGGIAVPRGRPTIRLHPDTAAAIETLTSQPVPDDPRGKWIAQPGRRSTEVDLALGAVLILDDAPDIAGGHAGLKRLLTHVFRRRLIAASPARVTVVTGVMAIARAVPVLTWPQGGDFDPASQQRRAADVAERLRTVLAEGR